MNPASTPNTAYGLFAAPFRRQDFLRFLACRPFYLMLMLLVAEAALAAASTWLIIKAGQDISQEEFLVADFVWIVVAQSASYFVGATSWIFAERAGFGAFGRYLMHFARTNRTRTALLADKAERESVEPFLTNETFHIVFELVYQLESALKLLFGLVFNALVLGVAIDAGLPVVYGVVFVVLLTLQWLVRKPVANAYLEQQRNTNRMTAHTYTAWDNIFSGNRYNFRLWHAGFKARLRGALGATIRAIMAREGLAATGGVIAMVAVFSYLALVAARNVGDAALLIGLAATLPRQIEMSSDVHGLASGWNDLLAIWTRIGGAADAMQPPLDEGFEGRVDFTGVELSQGGRVLPVNSVDEAVAALRAQPTGRMLVRGRNGAGKSTLLAALKSRLGLSAYYWPTTDRLAFEFSRAAVEAAEEASDGDGPVVPLGFSSGERQIKSLREIVRETRAEVYLLDEWDANLDAANRSIAEALVQELVARAVVIEISHRDRA